MRRDDDSHHGAGKYKSLAHAPTDARGWRTFSPLQHVRLGSPIRREPRHIDPEMVVFDRASRPVAIAHGGRPVQKILS